MISAPIPGPHRLAKALSTPLLPPSCPCMARKACVGKNQPTSRWPACPKGFSKLCPSPVPKPSSETAKLWTRTSDTRPPSVHKYGSSLPTRKFHGLRVEQLPVSLRNDLDRPVTDPDRRVVVDCVCG